MKGLRVRMSRRSLNQNGINQKDDHASIAEIQNKRRDFKKDFFYRLVRFTK
jgi:hypothetical protein